MTSESKATRILYENLDTSFVNLWAFLRYLSQRSVVGRVHVEMEDYAADIFLNGSETPLVREVDRSAGTEVIEETALHRLVLRVRQSPGSITVYEGAPEAVATKAPSVISAPRAASIIPLSPEPQAATPESMRSAAGKDEDAETITISSGAAQRPANAAEWNETARVSGELIGGIERATTSSGADFGLLFREARISLAGDYPFLDPMAGQMRYENSVFSARGEAQPEGYVTGITEVLTRVVAKLATGEKARRIRERVALELAVVARKQREALTRSGFRDHLDQIAGTKVL